MGGFTGGYSQSSMLTCPQRAQAHERDHRQIENEQEEDAEGVMQRVPDYTESPVRKALQIYEEKMSCCTRNQLISAQTNQNQALVCLYHILT